MADASKKEANEAFDMMSPMAQARLSPSTNPPQHGQAESAMHKADEVLASTAGFATGGAPLPSAAAVQKSNVGGAPATPKNLDLKHNDNSFHVLADLVVSHFNAKGSAGGSFTVADRAALEPMMPGNVRENFVEAVRYRLEQKCPPQSEANIHVLTRQCRELGLDREGDANPLLTTATTNQKPPVATMNLPPLGGKPREIKTRGPLPPMYHVRDDASASGSTLTGASMTEAHVSTTESLARQQLMAELRDASKFMADSKTAEAAKFWKEHVVKLQARLRALHGEATDRTSDHMSTSTPEQILESNRRVLEEYTPERYAPAAPGAREQSSPAYAAYQPPMEEVGGVVQQTRSSGGFDSFQMGSNGAPMVDVVAPANLPAGYVFEAEIDGQRFLATVPTGGVEKGETFCCLMRDFDSAGVDIPVGGWRDRLCDCLMYGPIHALFCNALFCPLIPLGQIMQRLNFDFLGRPLAKGKAGFRVVASIVIMWVSLNIMVFGAYNYKWSQHLELSSADLVALAFVNVVVLLYSIYAVSATRASLREKFMIREQRCYDLEDCCCATFCMPCTVCQMARHTADYDKYDAVCCSTTGLPDDVKLTSTGFANQARELV